MQEPNKANSEATKRTTIILEKEERQYIDSLIQEGKEAGIKPLISKMLNIYKNLMIYDWHYPREYYCGISRIAFVNVELLNIMLQHTPKENWREVGKTMGLALKVSMETTLEVSKITCDSWDCVFNRLKVQGFGDFYTKDKYILVKSPFLNEAQVLVGMLEGLLDVKLESKTLVPPLVFEVLSKGYKAKSD